MSIFAEKVDLWAHCAVPESNITRFYREPSGREVGYGLGSEPLYGFEYDIRYITQSSTGKDNGLTCKLGPQCDENIQKLAAAPSFLTYGKPLGRVWLGKYASKTLLWAHI